MVHLGKIAPAIIVAYLLGKTWSHLLPHILLMTRRQIRTSHNRCFYYGPFNMSHVPRAKGHLLPFGNDMTHDVNGIFVPHHLSDEDYLQSMAVLQSPIRRRPHRRHHHQHELVTPTLPNIPPVDLTASSFFSVYSRPVAFLTKGTLNDATVLKVQKSGCYVLGLFARFPDDSVQILGRWDPGHGEDISTATIYDGETGPSLQSIMFVFNCSDLSERYVQEVIVNNEREIDVPHFMWDTLHQVRCFLCNALPYCLPISL